MPHQTPVTFANRRGLRLFGVLETPSGGSPGPLVMVLLSPGVKMRVGPQALYRKLSDAILSQGVSVFRFDYHGLGDSEGTLPEEQMRDVYNHIESGRYVDDTIDAMDWLQGAHGVRRFVLAGLCGGAVTGLLAADRDSRVEGLLALGMPAVLSANAGDASRYMTAGQLQASERKYLRRLLSPQAWLRLITFRVDYRLIWRMGALRARRALGLPARTASAAAPASDNANPLFPPAFFAMLSRRRPMLLVFGGADRLRWEFEEKFLARHQETLAGLPGTFEVRVVAEGNHVLTLREWQREMLDAATAWLRSHFPADPGHAPDRGASAPTTAGQP